MVPVNASDKVDFGDGSSKASNQQSGQHGFFQNLQFGKGNSLSATATDGVASNLTQWLLIGSLAVGVVVWWILRKKG